MSAEESKVEAAKDEGKHERTFEIAQAAGLMMAALDANDSGIFAFAPEYWKVYRGQTEAEVGEILGVVSIGIFLSAPVALYLMPKVGGPHKIYWYGLLYYIFTRILILLLVFIPASAPTAYYYASLVSFALTGGVYGFTEIGCACWVLTSAKPEDRTKANAALMEGRGLGSIVGPALGGGLYSLGSRYGADVGFNLPLLVLALIMAALIFMNKKLVDSQDYADRMQGFTGFKSGLIFRSIPCTLMFVSGTFTISLMFYGAPIQQPMFAEDYDVPSWEYGIVYSLLALGFIIGSLLATPCEKLFGILGAVCFGCVGQGFFNMWLGPSPLLPFLPAASASTAWVPITGSALSYCFIGIPIVLGQPLMIKLAESIGLAEEDATIQVATFGILNMAVGFGCGSTLAGNIAQSVGYGWAFTYGSLFYIVASLILCFLTKVLSKPTQARTKSANRVALLDAPVV